MKQQNRPNDPRALAARSLVACEKSGKFSAIEIDAALRRADLSPADRALYTALVYGVIERRLTLDYLIARLSERDKLDPEVRTLCRLGLYQLRYMDKIPDHAAVSETVACAPRPVRGFVNAVLRTYQRRAGEIALPADDLSVIYSVDAHIVELWITSYGRETTEALLAATFDTRHTTVTANTLKTDVDAVTALLRAHGADPKTAPISPRSLRMEGSFPAASLDAHGDGLFFVQDEASGAAVAALDPQPGVLVIAVCSAPGGKSFAAAVAMSNRGRICSFDLHPNKLSLIRAGAERLGISIIETAARDGRTPDPDLVGRADRVLCDVPCSGLGILAKKPDLRYKDPGAFERLPAIQLDILSAASSYVKAGGTLVYSTCTLNKAENEDVVSAFLASHPEFSPCDFAAGPLASENGMLTLFPHKTGSDGFFITRLMRMK